MSKVFIDLAFESATEATAHEITNVKSVLVDTESRIVSVLYGDEQEFYVDSVDVSSISSKGVEITYA